MKLIITESQYRTIHEQFNSADENNIVGNPSENTLMFADFLTNDFSDYFKQIQ